MAPIRRHAAEGIAELHSASPKEIIALLYALLKFPARLAFHFYCRRVVINHKSALSRKGPLLIAANHPNSFLDAIVVATLFKQPVYSLVRGDVYTNSFFAFLLNALRMLPVYRISEGAQNLGENYRTFEKCREIFQKNGIVLIFSEGRCVNEWKLRPLKKGTARLAMSAWEKGIPLEVLPLGINFSSFRSFGKTIHLNFGHTITADTVAGLSEGNAINTFNHRLQSELSELVYTFDKDNVEAHTKYFGSGPSRFSKLLLALPAAIGWVIVAPLYFPLRTLTRRYWNNDHFDSIMVAMVFVFFPFYLLLLTLLSYCFLPNYWWVAIVLIAPFCAWAVLQRKW